MLQLILGGARSGKSRLAEQTAQDSGLQVHYVATAQALDVEMQLRIQHHQAQRPAHWQLSEEPLYLADCLQRIDAAEQLILVDCLTLWMTNLLLADDSSLLFQQMQKLLEVLPTLSSTIILVSNETGLGVVPMGELSRKFVDESGRLHQQLAQLADKVLFCVAGLSMQLKGDKS